MSKNSKSFNLSGFIALTSSSKKLLDVLTVSANQKYNVVGMQVYFATTIEELKSICIADGIEFEQSQFD
jgi:hypothetical protein